jgi:hypothetical protein
MKCGRPGRAAADQEAAMKFSDTLRAAGFAFAIAASLVSDAIGAEIATADQRAACTPDAFRLCEQNPAQSGDHRLHAKKPRKPDPALHGRVPEVTFAGANSPTE